MSERKQYVVGVVKIPMADRDLAHRYITPDRRFLDVNGSDTPDEDDEYPIGAHCIYRLDLTEEEAEEFRQASNCRYVELDKLSPMPAIGKNRTAFPSSDVIRFMEADFPRNDLYHGRDIIFGLCDSWTTGAARAAVEANMVFRTNVGAALPTGEETWGTHADMCLSAAVPQGGKFIDCQIMAGEGGSFDSAQFLGIKYCVDNGAKIILVSAAGVVTNNNPPVASSIELDMGRYVTERGAVMYQPAGNDGANVICQPSRLCITYPSNVLSIGAWDLADTGVGNLASFSNHSTELSGVMPGTGNVCQRGDVTASGGGTSIAGPFAALIARRAMTGGRFSAVQVLNAMKANCRTLGFASSIQGQGAFSLQKTLQALGAMTGNVHNAGGPYTNLSPNPTAATVTTNWAAGGSGARVTGLNLNHFDRDTGFSGTSSILTPKAVGSSGNSYTHSVTMRSSASTDVTVAIRWFNSSGTLLSTTNSRTISWIAGGVSRVTVTGTAPSSTSTSAMYITSSSGTLTVAAHIAELGTTGHPYFDGFSPNGVWTGGAGLSTSTVTFPIPAQELRYNLSSNPSFEVDLTGCTVTNVRSGVTVTTLARASSVTTPFVTNYAFVNTQNGGTMSGSLPDWIFNLPDANVNPGYTYMLSAHMKHQVSEGSVRWQCDWYDTANNLISSVTATNYELLWAEEFVRVYTHVVAPAGAAVARPKIQYWGGGLDTAPRSVRFDGIHIERVSGLARYFDGTETGATWSGTVHKSPSYIGTDTGLPPPPPTVTEIFGTTLNGSTPATSFNVTVPTGVTSPMVGVVLVATGSSNPAVITLTKTGGGGTFTKLLEGNAQNMRYSLWTCTGLVATNTINIALSSSEAITVGHYYQDGWTYEEAQFAIRSVSQATSITGTVDVGAGQKVLVVGAERTTAATTIVSATASGSETVTQLIYGEGTGSAQSSVYMGKFDASAGGQRTATITYSNSSANGFAAAILTSTSAGGGGGGGGGGSVVVLKPGVLHNIGKAGGKNHFNLGVGKTSGHVDITENALEQGFELPAGSAGDAFYYTKADGTAVVMATPLNGGKTSANTAYPRVEYRELQPGGSGDSDTPKAAWSGASDDHYLTGRTRMTKVPPNKPECVIGQIHGGSDDTAKFKWRGVGTNAAMIGTYGDDDYATVASGLSVGTEYQWKIRAQNGNILFYWVNMTNAAVTISDASLVDPATQYFKAGCYSQTNSTTDSTSNGPTTVELRDLVCWHTGYPPPTTTTTGAPSVGAGDDATVQVGGVFNRTATENANGSTISSRSWKIQSGPSGVGTTIDSDATVAWSPPTTGTFVLRYSAINSVGTGSDDVTITVTDAGGGGGGGGGASPYTKHFPDGQPYPVIGKGTATVSVASGSAFQSALDAASSGQKITLSAGTYSGSFEINGKIATPSAGISLVGVGAVNFGVGSQLTIKDCAHIYVEGLTLPYDGPGEMINIRGTSHHIQVSRCTLGSSSTAVASSTSAQYVYISDSAEYIRIDHNLFRNKGTAGNFIKTYGLDSALQACKHILVDHNIFTGCKPEQNNGKEPTRFGFSGFSKSMSYSVVERNYFFDNLCEPELVSIKAGGIRCSGNTFFRNAGGPVIRHGTGCIMTDNYIIDGNNTIASGGLKSGGTRFYDKDHTVSYNYMEGLIGENFQASLLVDTGDAEGSGTDLTAHWRVINAMIERNVIISCQTPIQVGDNYSSFPQNCTIRDNITAGTVLAGPITYLGGTSAATTGTVTNNTNYASAAAGGFVQDAGLTYRKAGYGPRITRLAQADVGPTGDVNDTDGTGVGVGGSGGSMPTANAGSDATALLNAAFTRIGEETGASITARQWQITSGPTQVGTVLSTSATVNWTPTVLGTYTLVYSVTNSFGTGSDAVAVTVTAGGGGGGGGIPVAFVGVGTGVTGAATTVTVPAPAGVENGNFQICVIQCAGEETMSTVPPEWQVLDELSATSSTGDPGGPTHTWVYYNTTGVAGDVGWIKTGTRFFHAVRAAWEGQTQLGQHVAAVGASASSHTTPSVTPAKPNSMVIGIVAMDLVNGDPGPFSPPAGWTERYDASKLQGTERETITIADVTVGAVATTGTFIGTAPDDSAKFAFVLEGPVLEQIMIPVSIP